jgi:hypothetical protein
MVSWMRKEVGTNVPPHFCLKFNWDYMIKVWLMEPGVVFHTYNPSPQEAEAGGF